MVGFKVKDAAWLVSISAPYLVSKRTQEPSLNYKFHVFVPK